MYPWQSGSDGQEETQTVHLNPLSGSWEPDLSRNQRHVSAAIFYAVWHYHQATNDFDFLRDCGAEMMLEIARFWASIAHYNPSATAGRSTASWVPTSSTRSTRARPREGCATTRTRTSWQRGSARPRSRSWSCCRRAAGTHCGRGSA